jgi:hypothetical protein
LEKNSGRKKSLANSLALHVIDTRRKSLLPLLKEFEDEFYLAGGTALALQLGHRESIDFDFFCIGKFEVNFFEEKVSRLFSKYKINISQLESDTLSILIDDEIKISFFKIPHGVLLPFVKGEWFQLCSELEIGAMKIAALIRAAYRYYVDLFFLLKKYSLDDILSLCEKKYPNFEKSVYLKALLSFDDIEITPIKFVKGSEKSPEEIFSFIDKQTKSYIKRNS